MAWQDLTQLFHPGMPHSPALPPAELEPLRRVEVDDVNVQRYAAATHVGTHVDAPRHFVPDGATIDELPLARFAGTGVVLDLGRESAGEVPLEEVRAAATDAGGIEEGDLALVRTGWGARFDDHDAYARYPWLAADVADWLLERGAKLLGVDTPSPDRPRAMRPDDWDAYPIHRRLLSAGVPIAEHLSLEDVAGERLEVVGFPVKLKGGDGAPIRMAGRRRDEEADGEGGGDSTR